MMTKINKFDCKRCPSLLKSRSRIVWGYGNSKADVMLVGLAPGRNGADQTGIPFTRDPSGVLIQEMLIKSGFSFEKDPRIEHPTLKVYLTNLVKCNPRDKHGRNRNPTESEILNCSTYLEREISEVNPKIIVPLGRRTANYFLRGLRITDNIWNKEIRWKDKIIFPIYHPGFIVRGGGKGKISKNKYLGVFKNLKKLVKSNASENQ